VNTYICKFKGRERNAFGVQSIFQLEVEASSLEEVYQKLYETHEHIDQYVFMNKDNPNDYKSSPRKTS